MTKTHYRLVFLLGALWNILGGIYILAATGQIFGRAGIAPPSPSLYYHSWIALFMVYGVGYYLAFLDMERHRSVIWLGVIGKLSFVSLCFYHLTVEGEQIPRFFLIPAAGDLVFAGLFSLFLASRPGQGRCARETRI